MLVTSHWLKRLTWILPLALLLVTPFYKHFSGKHAVNAYLKQLRANGEKLTIDELTPTPPANGFNGAAALQSASATVARLGPNLSFSTMKFVAPGKSRVTWQLATLPAETNANIWPDLKNLLDQYRGNLTGLHTALDAGWIDFNLDYNQGAMLPLPHIANLKSTVQFLCYMAILDFHQGNGDEAKKSLRSAIRLSQLYASEPLMISQLVDIAMMRIAWNAHWEALQYPEWKDTELADLQKIWESFSILQNAETALSMERAMERTSLQHLRSNSAEFRNFAFGTGLASSAGTNAWSSWFGHALPDEDPSFKNILLRLFGPTLWRGWWSYSQEFVDMHIWQTGIQTLRQTRAHQNSLAPLQALRTETDKWEKGLEQYQFKFPLAIGTTRFCERTLAAEVRRQMMLTAIALKRYHLRHSNYPAQLSELIPGFLTKLPIDLIDGQPLRYRLKDDQHFLLYAVGLDGKDDGGDPTEGPEQFNLDGKYTGRDWVYPEPATAEEIAADQANTQKKRGRR